MESKIKVNKNICAHVRSKTTLYQHSHISSAKKRFPSVRLPPASLKSEDFGTNFLYVEIGVSTAESSSQVHHIKDHLKDSESISSLLTKSEISMETFKTDEQITLNNISVQ